MVRFFLYPHLLGFGLLIASPAAAVPAGAGEKDPPWKPASPPEERRWSTAAYTGLFTHTRFNEIIRLQTDFDDSYVAALAVNRTLAVHGAHAEWEAEAQVARHWGRQHHFEVNAALLLRWRRYPWDNLVNTSVALGIGPSFALSTPALEEELRERVSRRLLFMPFEITAGPPGADSSWEVFTRVHHRSGAFDVISRAGGSNFVAAGLRVRF